MKSQLRSYLNSLLRRDAVIPRLTAAVDGHADIVTAQLVSGNYYPQLDARTSHAAFLCSRSTTKNIF